MLEKRLRGKNKMMRELIKHNLDFFRAKIYVEDVLNGGHTLSKELLNLLDFEKGQFFTLLPTDADLARLHEFSYGWILPQNETKEYIDEFGRKSSFSWTPTVLNEISQFIFEEVNLKGFTCFFEDVVRLPSDPHLEFFHEYGLLYLNELYYLIDNEHASQESIRSAIGEVNALWHLLFVVTKIETSEILGKEITLNTIKEICRRTQLLVVGAYDGEGFVFWESIEENAYERQS